MSGEDNNKGDEVDVKVLKGDRSHGFRLDLGLQPLSDLLGSLIEVNVSELPPPEDTSDRITNEEGKKGRYPTEADQHRKQNDQDRISAPKQCRIDARVDDDILVIVADIPSATEDDISVGIDQSTNKLVIARHNAVVGRVEIPWESPDVRHAWFNNGVLEVRVQPKEE
ncbi:gas vesicle protein GvpH [Haladaptatus sp. CMAA 1911]|uniref:gas vesicle protein GvpH n=1 Tax=unclassified Haladaptatus TaxID=2622732 RepID=UPI003754DC12